MPSPFPLEKVQGNISQRLVFYEEPPVEYIAESFLGLITGNDIMHPRYLRDTRIREE